MADGERGPGAEGAGPPPGGRSPDSHDSEDLARLGYAQQLLREMGGFSNFAVSFSIISVLTGAVLLFGYGLKLAGPVINTVGWPVVSLFTLAVAASMAELTSAYPTAGGLYYWAFRLGGRGWAWTTAWLNMAGQVTITAGINIAAAIYLIGAALRLGLVAPGASVPLLGAVDGWPFQLAVMVALLVPQILINVFGIRLTSRLNDISVAWHILFVCLIAAALTFLGRHHAPAGFLFESLPTVSPLEASSATLADGRTVPALVVGNIRLPSPLFALFPGLGSLYRAAPFALVFVLGLLQAQWTYTGYDASAHLAEETTGARRSAAWGVFLSVAVSAVVGYLLLVVLTRAIPPAELGAIAADPYPVLAVVDRNLPRFLANLIAVGIGGAMWLCGCSSVTSMGRMWYAVARDGGLPLARVLSRVHPRTRVPVAAILVASALSVLVCLYAAAFTVVTSISTISLYLAYGIPIWLHARRGRRERGPWSLGRLGGAVNAVAIVWIAFITVVFSLPPNELVLWTGLFFALFMALSWRFRARHRFQGPPAPDAPA